MQDARRPPRRDGGRRGFELPRLVRELRPEPRQPPADPEAADPEAADLSGSSSAPARTPPPEDETSSAS